MLKFIERILGKNKKTNNETLKVTPEIQFGKKTDNEVRELLKKATTFKKTNIEEAILLIKEALKIDPKYPCHDKLVNYLILAGKFDEAEEIITSLIQNVKEDDDIDNFSNRASYYAIYSELLFKKKLYKEYIFYYCLSIFNRMTFDTLNEQLDSVKSQLKLLKNKEEMSDRKTNKAFQDIGMSESQDLFIMTFYEVLNDFDFNGLSNLVNFLIHKQSNKVNLEIYAYENQKKDWMLWSSKEFKDTITLFDESLFTNKYKKKLEPILNQSNSNA
jgi:hypothetical protein